MAILHAITRKNRGYFLVPFLILMSLFLFSSCNKNDDDFDEQQQDLAGIAFFHSLPDVTTLNYYVGNQPVTNRALIYGERTSYLPIFSGTSPIYVVLGGTDSVLTARNVTFESEKFYSLFTSRVSPTNDAVTTILTEDDRTAPASGKAKIRFINLARDQTSLDLAAKDAANALFTNQAYNSFTQFIEINPATYTFQLKDTGTNNTRAESVAVNIEAGKFYTVWSKGYVGGAGNYALDLKVSAY